MKANAPEKIYLKPLHMEDGESVLRRCTFERQDENQIEYTRTDAFIEKACEFLEDRIAHESIDYPMATHWLIDDFRNYMKGE